MSFETTTQEYHDYKSRIQQPQSWLMSPHKLPAYGELCPPGTWRNAFSTLRTTCSSHSIFLEGNSICWLNNLVTTAKRQIYMPDTYWCSLIIMYRTYWKRWVAWSLPLLLKSATLRFFFWTVVNKRKEIYMDIYTLRDIHWVYSMWRISAYIDTHK